MTIPAAACADRSKEFAQEKQIAALQSEVAGVKEELARVKEELAREKAAKEAALQEGVESALQIAGLKSDLASARDELAGERATKATALQEEVEKNSFRVRLEKLSGHADNMGGFLAGDTMEILLFRVSRCLKIPTAKLCVCKAGDPSNTFSLQRSSAGQLKMTLSDYGIAEGARLSVIRLADSTDEPADDDSADIREGQRVFYHSETHQLWMAATVMRVVNDGPQPVYDLDVKLRARRDRIRVGAIGGS